VCLQAVVEKMKIYSYLHEIKNPYPQDDSYRPDNFKCLCSRISSTELERCHIIKYSIYKTAPFLIKFHAGSFFLMFLYTIDGKQSNLVCCHNDTLDCSTSRLPDYFKCLEL